MAKVAFDLYFDYREWKEQLNSYYKSGSNHGAWNDAKKLEVSYLYRHADLQDDERDRLCVVLPLVRLQIEKLGLTDELLRELELYYEDFNKGIFNDLFEDYELELVKEDLYWCYEHRKENLYKS